MADKDGEFIVRVQLEGGTSVEGGSAKASSVVGKAKTGELSSKNVAGAAAGALKGLGIVGGIAAIVGIISSFKPLVSMVDGLMKMLSALLMPVGYVIMALLYPILLLLKPIMIAVNQVIMPFFKQAMLLMREGALEKNAAKMGAGANVIMSGISAVIIVLFSSVIQMIGTMLYTTIAEVIGVFSPKTKDYILNTMVPQLNQSVELLTASAITTLAMGVVNLSEQLGTDSTTFINDFTSYLDTAFVSLSDTFVSDVNDALNTTKTDGLMAGYATLNTAVLKEIETFGLDMGVSLEGAFNSMLSALGVSVPSFAKEERARGWISEFYGKVKNYVRSGGTQFETDTLSGRSF